MRTEGLLIKLLSALRMPFADILKFPGKIESIIDQVTEFYSETEDVSCADYAFKILKTLEKVQQKETLLVNIDDKLVTKNKVRNSLSIV